MKVVLAGYTLDSDLIEELKSKKIVPEGVLTPETISAAYARISRYPEPVTVLRKIAREDVESARKSNKIIVFGMGHHSVAEHAQLNFDIMGISRLALEALETSRLCSYTEKSQRYITMKGEFVIPPELDEEGKKLLEKIMDREFEFYRKAYEVLFEYQKKLHPEMLTKKRDIEIVEGWAKEDARYILPLCCEAQLGFSGNARNIEYTIRKLRYHKLAEVRELSQKLYEEASRIAPSLIILSDPEKFKETFGREVSDEFFRYYEKDMREICSKIFSTSYPVKDDAYKTSGNVKLVDYTQDPDIKICAGILASFGGSNSYQKCIDLAKNLHSNNPAGFKSLIFKSMQRLSRYDAVPREFESVNFTFEIVLSASAFAQLKRHRMMTILKQDYDPNLGLTIPDSIIENGLGKEFEEATEMSTSAFEKIRVKNPAVSEYFLTNAHRRRAFVICNLRELYHMARIRMDPHAQWDIRRIVSDMVELARSVAPISASFACGKHEFPRVKQEAGFSEQLKEQSYNEDSGLKQAEVPEEGET